MVLRFCSSCKLDKCELVVGRMEKQTAMQGSSKLVVNLRMLLCMLHSNTKLDFHICNLFK